MRKNYLNVLFTLSFFTLIIQSYAETDPWALILPDNGGPVDMVQMNDSSFCILHLISKDSITVYNVSLQGELIWRTLITEDAPPVWGYSYLDIVSADDSVLVVSGSYNQVPLCIQLNMEGEIIREDVFNFENAAIFGDCSYIGSGIVWLTYAEINRGDISILAYDLNQGTLDSLNTFNPGVCIEHVLSPDSILLAIGSQKLMYVDSECNQIKQVDISVRNISNTALNENNGLFYSTCQFGTGINVYGIYCFSRNLDSINYFHNSVYYPTEVYASWMNVNDIIFNEQNEMILAGEIMYMEEWFPTFIKASCNTGAPDHIYTNYNFMPQYLKRIFRVENGYVELYYYEANEDSKTIIARVSEDGDLNKIEEEIVNISEVYPNPVDSGIHIELDHYDSGFLKLYNNHGIIVKTQMFKNKNKVFLNTSDVRNGNYYLIVEADTRSKAHKIIINHK